MARGKKKERILTQEEKLQQALVPKSEWPYKVPENWRWVCLEGICDGFQYGYTEKATFEKIGPHFIRITDIGDGIINDESAPYCKIEKDIYLNYKIHKDDLFIARMGSVGENGLATHDIEGVFASYLIRLVPRISAVFIRDYLQSPFYWSQITDKSQGTTRLNVNANVLRKIKFPLPPLSEQQRIVGRIESLFEKLDEAKEKVQAVVDSFEDRKAAILHRAFTGELTEGWRKSKGIRKDSWDERELISVLIDKPRNGYSPKPVNYKTPYKSMTLSATSSGVFLPEFYKYIDEEIPNHSYLWLKPGDILMQRANSLDKVGTSALYTGKEHEFVYPDLIMKLQVNESAIPEYIAYYLKTDKVLRYLRENATGTAGNMPKINQKVVSKTPVLIPTIEEQLEIVHSLDLLFDKEQTAKDTANDVLNQIDTMKKSILARAFRGELGTNDPSDESAEELLKRIL